MKRDENGAEDSHITIVIPVESDPDARFESCLNSRDDHGFDGSGLERSPNNYYVRLAVNGRFRYAHVRSESGDKALVAVHDRPDERIFWVRYYPIATSTSTEDHE